MKDFEKRDLIIDHLEDDLDPSLEEDIRLLLAESEELKSEARKIGQTRNVIAKSGATGLPSEPHYYTQLESKIMSRVKQTRKQSRFRVMAQQPRVWRSAASFAVAVLVGWALVQNFKGKANVMIMAPTGMAQSDHPHVDINEISTENLLLETTASDPSLVAETMFTNETDDDLLMDAMAMKLDSLGDQEATDALNQVMEQ